MKFEQFLSSWLCAVFISLGISSTSHAQEETPSEAEEVVEASERSHLQRLLAGEITDSNPLDVFRLLNQESTPLKTSGLVSVSRLQIVVKDTDGSVQAEAYAGDSGELLPIPERGYFELHYRGEQVMKVVLQARSVGFFGDYLTFITPGKDAEHSNISFMDFGKYWSSIGQADIPVFRIPVQVPYEQANYEITESQFVGTGPEPLPPIGSKEFQTFSDLQEIGFNITASLLDPSTYEDTQNLVAEIDLVFQRALELAASSTKQANTNATQQDEVIATIKDVVRKIEPSDPKDLDGKDISSGYRDEVLQRELLAQAAANYQKNRVAQQKLMARLRLLWWRLSLPQPRQASLTIKKGLVMASMGVVRGDSSATKEGVLQLINHRYVKFGTPLAAAALLGWADPALAEYAYESLDVGRTVFEAMWGKVVEAGTLLSHSAVATFSGFNPYVLHEAYIGNGRLSKLSVGMTAAFTTLFLSLGTPHIIVNTIKLGRDLKLREHLGGGVRRSINFVKSFPHKFVARQNWRQSRYLKALSASSLAETGGTQQRYTDEDNRIVKSIIEELKAQETPWISSLSRFTSKLPLVKRLQKSENPRYRLNSFSSALMHFLFSSCSFTLSGDAYARIWNGWFMFRSMVLRPVLSATFIYYPNYFKTALSNRDRLTIPTEMNGGIRPFYKEELLRLRSMFGDKTLAQLQSFEQKVAPLESAIEKAALNKAFAALLTVIDDSEEFKRLIETQGMDSVTDSSLDLLARRNRNFFRLYFMRAADLSMREVVASTLRDSGKFTEAEIADMSLDQYKIASESMIADVNLSSIDAASLVDKVVRKHSLHQTVLNDLSNASNFAERVSDRFNINIAGKLDPSGNKQVARYQSVNRQLDKPQAMARAVRSTIASIVVDKPLELGLLLVCLAGVTSGINQPLHDEMFGPNSWFYLGRYPFFTGYITGLMMQVMSNIWMKLQQDELHEGDFGKRPDSQYARRGFLPWYYKNFRAPNNTLWQNQKHFIKIIWANMPAALVVFVTTNVLTLGRLDLDTYITGYLIAYAVPLNGLAFKIEQAFELATGYFQKDIPEKYVSHPQVQKYLDRRISRARIWFNLYYKTYENVLWFFVGNLQTIETPELGTRSFARWIFRGYTPTELTVKGLTIVGDSWMGSIPGVKPIVNGCVAAFTNNYVDGDRL